jgi:hypothetical protein
MPALKHSRKGKSPVLEWIKTNCHIDAQTAELIFMSATQAKYLVQYDGHWIGNADAGLAHWRKDGKGPTPASKKLPSSSELVNPNTNPEFFNLYGKVAGAAFSRGSALSVDEVEEMCNRMWEGDPLRSVRQKQAMRVYRTYLKAKAQEEEEEGQPQEA